MKDDDNKGIQVASDLSEVFREKVRRIAMERGLSHGSADYLTKVLVQKSRNVALPSTLFDLYKKAVESEGSTAALHYRRLGDQALFVLGVFPEYLTRKAVGPSYYQAMGRSAYSSAAGILKQRIYMELSEDFGAATWTLKDVFEEFHLENETDILKLHEQWLSTGSLRVLRKLEELGLIIDLGRVR